MQLHNILHNTYHSCAHSLRIRLSSVFFRAFSPSVTLSRMSQQSPRAPDLVYQASDQLKALKWPEEDLTSTAEEGAGFYPLRLGETLDDGRFVITRKLGWGGYSSVWLARDRKDDRHVALKVLSAHASSEIESGRLGERDLLQKVTKASPLHHGYGHVVHLFHEFSFDSFAGQHICFVMDVLSYSVSSLQSQFKDPRLPLKFILRFTKHVLKGLEYLHDECRMVHSDLKPGNVLLLPSDTDNIVMHELSRHPGMLYDFPKTISPDELPIHPVLSTPLIFAPDINADARFHWVIADLGHAHFQRKHLSKIVQPYALRAPEVILGLEWGSAIDIWSLGCMMFELAIGHRLFNPKVVNDISRDVVHLAQMAQRTNQDHDEVTLKQYGIREKLHDLKGTLRRATVEGGELTPVKSELNKSTVYSNGDEEVAAFVRIMRSFLALDPSQRPRAVEALLDPSFEDI